MFDFDEELKKLPAKQPAEKKPVAKKASPAKAQQEKPVAVKKAADEASAKLVAVTPGEATRAALERTRRKVIDEVIEEKVDSIVTEFFD